MAAKQPAAKPAAAKPAAVAAKPRAPKPRARLQLCYSESELGKKHAEVADGVVQVGDSVAVHFVIDGFEQWYAGEVRFRRRPALHVQNALPFLPFHLRIAFLSSF